MAADPHRTSHQLRAHLRTADSRPPAVSPPRRPQFAQKTEKPDERRAALAARPARTAHRHGCGERVQLLQAFVEGDELVAALDDQILAERRRLEHQPTAVRGRAIGHAAPLRNWPGSDSVSVAPRGAHSELSARPCGESAQERWPRHANQSKNAGCDAQATAGGAWPPSAESGNKYHEEDDGHDGDRNSDQGSGRAARAAIATTIKASTRPITALRPGESARNYGSWTTTRRSSVISRTEQAGPSACCPSP